MVLAINANMEHLVLAAECRVHARLYFVLHGAPNRHPCGRVGAVGLQLRAVGAQHLARVVVGGENRRSFHRLHHRNIINLPEVFIRRRLCQPKNSLSYAVLFDARNLAFSLVGDVAQNIHHGTARANSALAGRSAHREAHTRAHATLFNVLSVQRHVVGIRTLPSLDRVGGFHAGIDKHLTRSRGDRLHLLGNALQGRQRGLAHTLNLVPIHGDVAPREKVVSLLVGQARTAVRHLVVDLGNLSVSLLGVQGPQVGFNVSKRKAGRANRIQQRAKLLVAEVVKLLGRTPVVQLLLQVGVDVIRNLHAGLFGSLNNALGVDLLVLHVVDEAVTLADGLNRPRSGLPLVRAREPEAIIKLVKVAVVLRALELPRLKGHRRPRLALVVQNHRAVIALLLQLATAGN